ncbi:MAG: cytochrome c [Anaerolineae bacterium]|nr:cytochrome c [Anaerolineae bacterium]
MQYHFSLTLIGVLILIVTACGSKSAPTPTTEEATLTPFPTYNFVQPTAVPFAVTSAATVQADTSTQALDPEKVALGKGRYEALNCGSCHGVDAKGTDKGKALVPNTLTEDQFIDFLRSGGKLGNDHLYSTNRLSDTGSRNLYLYIVSLSAGQ